MVEEADAGLAPRLPTAGRRGSVGRSEAARRTRRTEPTGRIGPCLAVPICSAVAASTAFLSCLPVPLSPRRPLRRPCMSSTRRCSGARPAAACAATCRPSTAGWRASPAGGTASRCRCRESGPVDAGWLRLPSLAAARQRRLPAAAAPRRDGAPAGRGRTRPDRGRRSLPRRLGGARRRAQARRSGCRLLPFEPRTDGPHGGRAAPRAAVAGRTARAYARRLYERFDLVLAPSRSMADHLADWGVSRVAQQPLGVDTAVFHPSRASAGWRAANGIAPSTRLLVYAGRFAPEKHLDVLAEAVRRLGGDYLLLAIGAGPAPPPAGDRIRRLPFVAGSESLAAALASADAFVHAGDQETFGLAVLEAMACGTPVVARSAEGLAELVDDSVGAAVARRHAGGLRRGDPCRLRRLRRAPRGAPPRRARARRGARLGARAAGAARPVPAPDRRRRGAGRRAVVDRAGHRGADRAMSVDGRSRDASRPASDRRGWRLCDRRRSGLLWQQAAAGPVPSLLRPACRCTAPPARRPGMRSARRQASPARARLRRRSASCCTTWRPARSRPASASCAPSPRWPATFRSRCSPCRAITASRRPPASTAGSATRARAGDELSLHGWTHRDDGRPAGWLDGLRRSHYTRGEGEFWSLTQDEAAARIAAGRAWFDANGWTAHGFVAPAWLLGPGAWAALRAASPGFAYTSTLRHIHRLPRRAAA